MRAFIALFVLGLAATCTAVDAESATCVYKNATAEFDLSALPAATVFGDNNITYHISACTAQSAPLPSCPTHNTTDNTTISCAGYQVDEDSGDCWCLGLLGTQNISPKPNNLTEGFIITFTEGFKNITEGNVTTEHPASLAIELTCGEGNEDPSLISATGELDYAFAWVTSAACALVKNETASPSPSPSPSASNMTLVSPTPSPSPPHEVPSKDDSQGSAVVVAILPFLFVVGAATFYVYQLRQSRSFIPRPTYLGLLGGVMWGSALIALACSGSVIAFEDKALNLHPFKTSYVQFLCASTILVWLYLFAVLTIEFTKMNVEHLGFVTRICEALFILFLFAAATAASVHFDGKHDYCAYYDESACTTYRASIFFTWVVFYMMCVKLFLDCLTSNTAQDSFTMAGGQSRV